MTLREKQVRFLQMEAMLILRAKELGLPIVRLEWMRSPETQESYVVRGVSKTMYSKHLVGLASDYCFLADLKDNGKIDWSPEKYRELGEFWESLGGRWGGRFGDDPNTPLIEGWDCGHFEYDA